MTNQKIPETATHRILVEKPEGGKEANWKV